MEYNDVREDDLRENPPDLGMFDSIRDIGYSVENAIADLLDNSISANAKNIIIDIKYDKDNSYIRIEDDGDGMDETRLYDALTFGKKVGLARFQNDLGRFGLGLKSASLSQGKRLTVSSRIQDQSTIGVWDTDLVNYRQKWVILTKPFGSTVHLLQPKLDDRSGTILVIEILDKLLNEKSESSELFYEKIRAVKEHLSLVFHRYLQATGDSRIKLVYQGSPLIPINPFEFPRISIKGKVKLLNNLVTVQSFILPHETKMSKADIKKANLEKGMTLNQGFYIYRANRLIVAGGWLNMSALRSIEPTKLCRIMIDIPNSLDELWGIDVKKSKALIPNEIYKDVETIVRNALRESENRYKHRSFAGNNPRPESTYIWFIRNTPRGKVYTINRAHPLILLLHKFADSIGKKEVISILEGLLKHIENNLPIMEIISDGALQIADISDKHEEIKVKTQKIAETYKTQMNLLGFSDNTINEILKKTDLFI